MICHISSLSREVSVTTTTDCFHFHPEGLELHLTSNNISALQPGLLFNLKLELESNVVLEFSNYKLTKVELNNPNTHLAHFETMELNRALQTRIFPFNNEHEIVLDSNSFAYMPDGLFIDCDFCPGLENNTVCTINVISNNQLALSLERCVFEGCDQVDEHTKIVFFSTDNHEPVMWKKEGF